MEPESWAPVHGKKKIVDSEDEDEGPFRKKLKTTELSVSESAWWELCQPSREVGATQRRGGGWEPWPPSQGAGATQIQVERWITGSILPPTSTMSNRRRPYRCPPYPKGGSKKKITKWNTEIRKISKLAANDPVTYPPILRKTEDSDTASAVKCSRDKNMVFRAAQSVVSVFCTGHEGVTIKHCTGILMSEFDFKGRAKVITCAKTVCDDEGKLLHHKLLIRLPNNTIKDGELLFFDHYYNLALLEFSTDMPLWGLPFVSSLNCGDEVFVLARNESLLLMVRNGSVLWHDEPYLERSCYMYLSCELPQCGEGGPVIDQDGNVTGMAIDLVSPNALVLPSFIIMKCIEMARKFSCIARPIHGMCLKSIEFLDVQQKDKLFRDHNIDRGYLVDQVEVGSTSDVYGIRPGDVIVLFDGIHSETLLQVEDYLLSLGWEFLDKKFDSNSKVLLKLQMYNPLECCEFNINLPVGFSCFPTVATIHGDFAQDADDPAEQEWDRGVLVEGILKLDGTCLGAFLDDLGA